ncbi:hypothetical protein GobsT_35700 [Gemmata obscuriglobus]|uniref:Uncharacterized protein n=1 Tax=Gemmata obscuriglobus TaxID=114 RepID=A0A2Z3GX17_9BACT|nr:hypothetical protein [Gemmata obscuriglobus]AWM38303.1 hypothetical protein C1280_15790 [Gemmata obscuriglobus]QEG28783.1 hypothetical protein GobsT_35700 [Gemmata obscuriglobus]VTS07136.1 unnamed protein product [Gemmata obscuriglobus UQM 2246]
MRLTDLWGCLDQGADRESVCTWRRGCPVNIYPLLEADQEDTGTGSADRDVKVWANHERAEQSWSAACIACGRRAAGLEG